MRSFIFIGVLLLLSSFQLEPIRRDHLIEDYVNKKVEQMTSSIRKECIKETFRIAEQRVNEILRSQAKERLDTIYPEKWDRPVKPNEIPFTDTHQVNPLFTDTLEMMDQGLDQ